MTKIQNYKKTKEFVTSTKIIPTVVVKEESNIDNTIAYLAFIVRNLFFKSKSI